MIPKARVKSTIELSSKNYFLAIIPKLNPIISRKANLVLRKSLKKVSITYKNQLKTKKNQKKHHKIVHLIN